MPIHHAAHSLSPPPKKAPHAHTHTSTVFPLGLASRAAHVIGAKAEGAGRVGIPRAPAPLPCLGCLLELVLRTSPPFCAFQPGSS
jgi:hypothetical protein